MSIPAITPTTRPPTLDPATTGIDIPDFLYGTSDAGDQREGFERMLT
jgi:hypothetical protein